MKVYTAKHKETGELWRGRQVIYENKGGLKASMKTCRYGAEVSEYDIYEHDLDNGRIVI
jgi:hypothetical protein